jgi:ArsR family transcriptional regulator
VNDLATTLKALADPVRLSILEFLLEPVQSCCSREDGVCACDLETFLGLAQPTVSHHMKLLVQAGFVQSQKRGRWVYYELNPAAFSDLKRRLEHYERAPQGETLVTSRP